MRNYRIIVRYDGTEFLGWQTQPGYRTVQETIQNAIGVITQESRVRLNASGRTDAGVHAVGQVANFYSVSKLSGPVLVKAINANLPDDVCVRLCDVVPQSFCANKDALRKMYRYVITDARMHDPFLCRFADHCRKPLDTDAMIVAAKHLLGRHDFRSFETKWPNRLSSIRTITHASVIRIGETIWVDVEATGFLYNMVRAIAGTLVKVGRHEWPPEHVARIIARQDRREAGPNAPPQGLFLMRVTYPKHLETAAL